MMWAVALTGGLLCGTSAQAAEPYLTAALGDVVVKLVEVEPKVTQVVVDDKTIFEDRESTQVSFVNAYTVQGRWMALLQTETGAKDCPARFRILDLGAPKPSVSLPFGSCSDAAQVTTSETALTVSMPVPSSKETAAWTYQGGRIARSR
ncbi:hypothetical protein [Azospirillum doebereinerae]